MLAGTMGVLEETVAAAVEIESGRAGERGTSAGTGNLALMAWAKAAVTPSTGAPLAGRTGGVVGDVKGKAMASDEQGIVLAVADGGGRGV